MIRLTIPYPKSKAGMTAFCKAYGLNAYWSGKHPKARARDAKYWHELTHAMLFKQGIQKSFFNKPVVINFYWNDGMDCTNHTAIGKMVEDALKGWVIKDDSRKYVQGVCHWFHDKDYILVEVTEI